MTFMMMMLVALAMAAIAATVRDVVEDRGRPQRPATHHEDPMFCAPAARI